MKRVRCLTIICLSLSVFAYGQSFRTELAKIRSISVIESTRQDVQKILVGYKSDIGKDEKEPILEETFS